MLAMLPVIEQAIKDALHRAITDPSGKYYGWVKAVKSYGGEFDSDDFAQVVRCFPAIWTTFKKSSKPARKGATKRVRQFEFTVLVAAKSNRTEETARQGAFTNTGDMLGIGSYQLIALVDEVLDGNNLGLSITLESGAVSTVFNTQTNGEAVSVLALDVTATMSYTQSHHDEDDSTPWLDNVTVHYQDYMLDPKTGMLEPVDVGTDLITLLH